MTIFSHIFMEWYKFLLVLFWCRSQIQKKSSCYGSLNYLVQPTYLLTYLSLPHPGPILPIFRKCIIWAFRIYGFCQRGRSFRKIRFDGRKYAHSSPSNDNYKFTFKTFKGKFIVVIRRTRKLKAIWFWSTYICTTYL